TDVGIGRRASERTGLGVERHPRRLALDGELEEVVVGVRRLRREGIRLARLDARVGGAGNLGRGVTRWRRRRLVRGLLDRLLFFLVFLETTCQRDCRPKHEWMP